MDKVYIGDRYYDFVWNFKEDPELRRGFNALARDVFDFDFEDYYLSGYWNDRYVPYALMDGGKVVANVSVNILDFFSCGDVKRYVQIGTVMTDGAYRGRGLSRYLLERVISEWKAKSEMIYLFANDTVVDFYPKFGFAKKTEYQYAKAIAGGDGTPRHLDMDDPQNRALLFRLSESTRPFSKLTALKNTALVMFYATSFMKDDFHYVEGMDAAVFARYDDRTLYLNDVFCPGELSIDEVISVMAKRDTSQVVLGFTPLDTDGYSCKPYLQDNDTLFVLTEGEKSVFDNHRLMLPILSHA